MTPTLRPLRPGDLGWIVAAQSRLYATEYGWGPEFEAVLLRVALDYAESTDPDKAGWIAEAGGQPLGAALLIRRAGGSEAATTAQLRAVHVEQAARGQGIGGLLLDAVLAHARARGFTRMVLETKDVLTAAHALYRSRGFALVEERAQQAYGQSLHEQTWARDL